MVLVSRYYAQKLWPRQELAQAQARAFAESREYILPIRLDDTALPGFNPTVGYIDIAESSVSAICDLILRKLGRAAVASPTDAISHPALDDDEPELLDLRVEMDDAFRASMEALAKISELSTRGAEADRERQAAAAQFVASGERSPRRTQELVNRKAADFAKRARSLAGSVATYRSDARTFFDALERLIDYQIRRHISTPEEMKTGLRTFARADAGAVGVRRVYTQLADTARGLSTPTRQFKRQRNAFVGSVEDLNAAVDYWLERAAAVRARFEAD